MFNLSRKIEKHEILNRVDLSICEIERRIDQINEMRQQGKEANLMAYLDEVQCMVNDTKLLMKEAR